VAWWQQNISWKICVFHKKRRVTLCYIFSNIFNVLVYGRERTSVSSFSFSMLWYKVTYTKKNKPHADG
jgi:hypothetical protein